MASYLDDPERWRQYFIQGTGNPYAGGGTMEEQIAAQLRQVDPSKIPPGPSTRDQAINQASQSTMGAQSQLANQQAYADMLRGTAMPQGKEVGPSGIYVNNIWDSAEAGFNRALGGYMSGQLKDQYADIDAKETGKARGIQNLEDIRTGEERAFTSGESEQEREARVALERMKQLEQARQGMLDRRSRESVAQAQLTGQNERARAGNPYMLDGKVMNIVKDRGNYYLGTIEGRKLTPDEMERAVLYESGDQGTMSDKYGFQMPVEESGQAPPGFLGNLLTSDYFDESTGALNVTRWLGPVAMGPNGEMVQATQSQMATAVLEPMSQRMEEINLRPWTEKEIETITRDFPGLNSKYPQWASFTYNTIRPMLERKFQEAIQAGRSNEQTRKMVMDQLDADMIEGARKNGMNMRDLERLGVPKKRIVAYLKRLEAQ